MPNTLKTIPKVVVCALMPVRVAAPWLMLAACSANPRADQLAQQIAQADARTAAAEARIRIAAQALPAQTGLAAASPAPRARALADTAPPPGPGNGASIGVNTVAFRDRSSGPTNEIP